MKEAKSLVYTKLIREAASLIPVRDGPEDLEVFMLKRQGRGVFPDLHVFPGGKVDEEDTELADRFTSIGSENHPPLRFKAAAIRECFEECGVFLGESDGGQISVEQLRNFKHEVLDDKIKFNDGLDQLHLKIRDERVLYFSHWITPPYAPARFDTRFFITQLTRSETTETHDREAAHGSWQRPEEALWRYSSKEWQMIVPTITTLRMISGFSNAKELIDSVRTGKHRIPVPAALQEKGMQPFVGIWCSL